LLSLGFKRSFSFSDFVIFISLSLCASALKRRLQATGFRLQAAGCRLQASGYRLQAAGFRLQATALVLVLVLVLGFFLHRVSRKLMLVCG
jgi:hypothetical protein